MLPSSPRSRPRALIALYSLLLGAGCTPLDPDPVEMIGAVGADGSVGDGSAGDGSTPDGSAPDGSAVDASPITQRPSGDTGVAVDDAGLDAIVYDGGPLDTGVADGSPSGEGGTTTCKPGTAVTPDRSCAPCAAGSYSTEINAKQCTLWTDCQGSELTPGSATANRVCGPKPWTAQLGTAASDHGYGVAVDAQGNVVFAGSFGDIEHGRTAVRKYDRAGKQLWAKDSMAGDISQALAVGPGGTVVIAGVTLKGLDGATLRGINDVFVRNYDAAGNVLWTRQLSTDSNDYGRGLTVDKDGQVVVVGYTFGTLDGQVAQGMGDAFMRKYDKDGNTLWTRQFGTDQTDYAVAVAVDDGGNIFVAGQTYGTFAGQTSNVNGVDPFVRKYDGAGNEVWTRQFGPSTDNAGLEGVAVDASGNVAVVGSTEVALPGQMAAGDRDAFIRVFDTAGKERWTVEFGSATADSASDVVVDSRGNYVVVGNTNGALTPNPAVGGGDAFVRVFDSAGMTRWTKQLGTSTYDVANAVALDAEGQVVLAGDTQGMFAGQTSLGSDDAFITWVAP